MTHASDEPNLRNTVVKVAHHGSATSSTPVFLEAVAPRVAIISVGAFKSVRASAPRHAVGAAVYRTDLHGAVTVTSDGMPLGVHTARDAGDR